MQVISTLAEFLHTQGLLGHPEAKTGLLTAVSGGSDSMALLAAIHRLSQDNTSITVQAAHLIHHPESEQAQARANLVRRFCADKAIPLEIRTLAGSSAPGESPEEWMRRERYQFLEQTARQTGCDWILTAHHADDQAETILHRIAAGVGTRGLAGIKPRRGNLLRPFLTLHKLDLLNYCLAEKVPFAEDPANLDLSRPRNRIRHMILPLLERELNPEIRAALIRLSRWAAEAQEVVEALTAECLQKAVVFFQKGEIVLDIDAILPYFVMIRKNALREVISRAAGEPISLQGHDLDRLAEFLHRNRTGAQLEFPGNVRVLKHRRQLIIFAGEPEVINYRLTLGQNRELPQLNLSAVWQNSPQPPYRNGAGLTADMVLGQSECLLTLRHAREGDHFQPLGVPGPKRLFRFLTDRKVSRLDKRRTLVLERDGEIIWVVGHRISQKVRLAEPAGGTWRLSLLPLERSGCN